MQHDGEGAINHEELFADDHSPAYEQERIHQDELYSLMNSILDWAISFLGESTQGTIRAIYFEGKTVKQHSEEEYVTVHAIYKRLKRSYPVIKEVVLEELEDLDDETRASPKEMDAVALRKLGNLACNAGRDQAFSYATYYPSRTSKRLIESEELGVFKMLCPDRGAKS